MPPGKGNNAGPDWEAILSGKTVGFGHDCLRCFLEGASGLYGAGLGLYLKSERWGVRRRTMLPVPTISIGNLSVGGTGKTPMTQSIARILLAEGRHPAILSRGYRGSLRGRSHAVSDREGNVLLSAQEAGDEPFLLANSLRGVPVIVGKDRRVSGRLAIEAFKPDVILLDDAFQYWQLARDLDIVLLDARRPFDNGFALPRGLLREPKRNLSRAGIVVLTRADGLSPDDRDKRLAQVRESAPKAHIFWARHVPGAWRSLNDAARGSLPRRAIALCGIARPESFVRSVQECGVEIIGNPIAYFDHQSYGPSEMRTILGKIRDYPDTVLVTTEKDATKLDVQAIPVAAYALDVRVEIEDADAFRAQIFRVLVRSSS